MIDRLTASSIRDWRNNPRLFFYRHVLRIKQPVKAPALVIGGAIHEGIDVFYKTGSSDQARHSFIDEITSESYALRAGGKDLLTVTSEGLELLDSFFGAQDYLKVVHDISPVGKSEYRFRDTSWSHPLTGSQLSLPITGIVDRVTEDGDILEFKTSNKPYKQEDIDAMVQPTIYSHWHLAERGFLPRRVVYVVMIKGRKKDPIQVLETKRDIPDFILLHEEMEAMISEINKGNFPDRRSSIWTEDIKSYEALLGI